MSAAKLIIADSEKNANLYYATRFLAPDPFIFAQLDGRTVMIMSDLEIDRARSQAKVTEIISYTKLSAQAKQRLGRDPAMMDVVDELLKSWREKELDVPMDFGVVYADRLRALG